MKLYMIRHGQSEANFAKVHAGWAPFHLTEKGRSEAERIGGILEGISFDKVYSSDVLRAVETQQIAMPEAECERISLIREINSGNLIGKSFAECTEKFGESYTQNRKLFEFAEYEGESYADFCARLREFLTMMENSGYEKVAVFCHGGVINTLLDIITGERLERRYFSCANCSLSIFEFKKDFWSVKLWNYLGEL